MNANKNKKSNEIMARELEALKAEIAQAQRAAEQAKQVAKQAVALARGTGDVSREARAAIVQPDRPKITAANAHVGDESPTPDLVAAVRALCMDRPHTFPELLEATGARRGRVSGAIVQLQRDPDSGLVKMPRGGQESRALWWIPDRGTLARITR